VLTGKVHGYHVRTVADVPVDGRQVVARVRVRRVVCPVLSCRRQTFREQVPGLIERLQRRTTRLTRQVSQVVKKLCGRAASRLTRFLATPLSYATLEAWLRGKNEVEAVCRDGSATYAEAIRRALPDAVQVSDRWHLWKNLCDKILAEVRAHAPCWGAVTLPVPASASRRPASAGTQSMTSSTSSVTASCCSD
jgi:transposase